MNFFGSSPNETVLPGTTTENGLIDEKDSRGLGFPAKNSGIFDKDSSEMLKDYKEPKVRQKS